MSAAAWGGVAGGLAALGLLVAAAAVLFVLPPLLALTGRRAFWPSVPQVRQTPVDLARDSWWGRLATRVLRRPLAAVLAGTVLLAVARREERLGLARGLLLLLLVSCVAGLKVVA